METERKSFLSLGEKKKKKNLHKPFTVVEYGPFYIPQSPALPQKGMRGNRGGGTVSIRNIHEAIQQASNSVCFAVALSLPHTHTHIFKFPDGLLTWKGEQPHRDTDSRMYIVKICTFLIIKLCQLNEQTPATVLY